MDLKRLEKAAEIIFKLCENHPELCPHDYELVKMSEPDVLGQVTCRYECSLCGDKYQKVECLY